MPVSREGVSVEKCIAIINVLKEAGPAAIHHGEAAEEYHKALTGFESLCTSLHQLQTLEQTTRTRHAEAAQAQSTLQDTFLSDLLHKAERYVQRFEALAPSSRTHRFDMRPIWSRNVSMEVAKLRDLTEARNEILNLVFQLVACASVIGNHSHLTKNKNGLLDSTLPRNECLALHDSESVHEVQMKVSELFRAINNLRSNAMQQHVNKQQASPMPRDTSEGALQMITDKLSNPNGISGNLNRRSTNSSMPLSSNTVMERFLSPSVWRTLATPESLFANLQSTTNFPKHLVSLATTDKLQVHSTTDRSSPSPPTSNSMLASTTSASGKHLHTRDMSSAMADINNTNDWDLLIATVSDIVYRFVIDSLWKMLCLFPTVLILLRSKFTSFATIPTNILQDNIRFEDVLGRTYSLPYEYFREWPIFRAMLVSRFKDLPGSNQVTRGYFRILSTALQERIFDETNWHRTVLPGSSLAMAILLKRHKLATGSCLQIGCGGSTTVSADLVIICNKCGLRFRQDFIPLTRPLVELMPSSPTYVQGQAITELVSNSASTGSKVEQQLDGNDSTVKLYEGKSNLGGPDSAENHSAMREQISSMNNDSAALRASRIGMTTISKLKATNKAENHTKESSMPSSSDFLTEDEESQDEEEQDLTLFRRIRVRDLTSARPYLSPVAVHNEVAMEKSTAPAAGEQYDIDPATSHDLQFGQAYGITNTALDDESGNNDTPAVPVSRPITGATHAVHRYRSSYKTPTTDDASTFDMTDRMRGRRGPLGIPRSSSQGRTGLEDDIFLVDIDHTLRDLLEQEDTDLNFQITIDDLGPKEITLGTLGSAGYKTATLRGSYAISNLLQELMLAKDLGQKVVRIHKARLQENPVDRLQRHINSIFWENLTHTYFRHQTPDRELSGLAYGTVDIQPRIYISPLAEEQYTWFRKYLEEHPNSQLDVCGLPLIGTHSAVVSKLTMQDPGILALATRPVEATRTESDLKNTADGSSLSLEPYVSPHGVDSALSGWHSYFVILGLLTSNKVDLAKSIVNNLCFCIRNYGKVVQTNRLHSIGRSQPPLLTSMILSVFDRIQLDYGAHDWLRLSLLAAIKEYYLVWTANFRYDRGTGLSKYGDDSRTMPPEIGRTEFPKIIVDRAASRKLEIQEFIEAYNANEIHEPEVEDYVLQRGAEIESGHSPTQRFGGRAAHLVTIDLNSLLYKYEVDIAQLIRTQFDDRLELPQEFREVHPSQHSLETSSVWDKRAKMRKARIDKYLWNEQGHAYHDFDIVMKKQTKAISATMFWALWAGVSSPRQASELVRSALPRLEAHGGLMATVDSEISVLQTPPDSWDSPFGREFPSDWNSQFGWHAPIGWDAPFGWAPHQILAWIGLVKYNYIEACERLIYRWLLNVTTVFSDYNGTVVDRYHVTGPHRPHKEDGTIGNDFKFVNKHGCAWTNASFLIGLSILPLHKRRALGALVPWDTFEKATDFRLDDFDNKYGSESSSE